MLCKNSGTEHVALLRPCRDRSSNQGSIWQVDSQLCKRSPLLQLGPVKVWAARCFCTESLSKLTILHDSVLAVEDGYSGYSIDSYFLSLHVSTVFVFTSHEPKTTQQLTQTPFCAVFAWISCLPFANCMIYYIH